MGSHTALFKSRRHIAPAESDCQCWMRRAPCEAALYDSHTMQQETEGGLPQCEQEVEILLAALSDRDLLNFRLQYLLTSKGCELDICQDRLRKQTQAASQARGECRRLQALVRSQAQVRSQNGSRYINKLIKVSNSTSKNVRHSGLATEGYQGLTCILDLLVQALKAQEQQEAQVSGLHVFSENKTSSLHTVFSAASACIDKHTTVPKSRQAKALSPVCCHLQKLKRSVHEAALRNAATQTDQAVPEAGDCATRPA